MVSLLLLFACQPEKSPTNPDDSVLNESTPLDSEDSGDSGTTTPWPWTTADQDTIRDALERDMGRSGAFAAQIAVWYNGEIVWSEAIGSRSSDGTEPIDTQTLFQIGSDTKKLTAISLLQHVSAGQLSLDMPVSTALPGFSLAESPDWADQTTLHDLISHQGGLYDYTPWDNFPDDADLHDRSYGEVAAHEWAMAPAERMWNYSNPNFSLAGLAVENADTRPWPDIISEDIFAPLGMTRSFARLSEVVADGNVGNSYGLYNLVSDPLDLFAQSTYDYGEVAAADVGDNAFIRPAGLVWSNAEDQARLLGFLVEGDSAVLSDELRRQITDIQVALYPNFPYQGYGYGMFVFEGFSTADGWCPEPQWSHGGNTLSYTSTSIIYPNEHLAISILTNAYGVDTSKTQQAINDTLITLPAATDWPVDLAVETDHNLLVGTYVDPQLGRIEITDDNGTLHAAFPDVTAEGWSLDSDLSMYWTDEYALASGTLRGYDITFIPDENGDYTYIRNRSFVGTRSEVMALATRPSDRPATFSATPSPRPLSVPQPQLQQRH